MSPSTGEHPALVDTQPVCAMRMANIEHRLESLEKAEWRGDIKELTEKVNKLGQALENLNGRLVGYLAAASILATVLASVAQYVLRK